MILILLKNDLSFSSRMLLTPNNSTGSIPSITMTFSDIYDYFQCLQINKK